MQAPDKLSLSWDQNPSVRESLANMKPGDKFVIELHTQIDSIDPDSGKFTIEAAVPEGYELDDAGDNDAQPGTIPSDTTPVGMVVRMKEKASRSKSPSVPPAQPARVSAPPTL